jgi:hypothetical protein
MRKAPRRGHALPMVADISLLHVKKFDDRLSKFLTAIFLQKMSTTSDGCVGLALCAGDQFLKDTFTAGRNRIAVAEGGQEWFGKNGLYPGFITRLSFFSRISGL